MLRAAQLEEAAPADKCFAWNVDWRNITGEVLALLCGLGSVRDAMRIDSAEVSERFSTSCTFRQQTSVTMH